MTETHPENRHDAAARLARNLASVTLTRTALMRTAATREASLALRQWQSQRLERTYPDLVATSRYHDAARFFLDDLYGPKDFSQRDADLARILPKLKALLPAAALSTIADAVELDLVSEEMDRVLIVALAAAPLDETTYAAAYRACDNRAARERQIVLVRHIGNALDTLTHIPLLAGTLKLMRTPARAANLEELQNFLERGFTAFKKMGGARSFLDTLETRETLLMNRLFAGVEAPFAGLIQKTIS